MSEIAPNTDNLLLEIKPVEEVVNEPDQNNIDIEKKMNDDLDKEIEVALEEEQENNIFEKKVKPKKKKRQLSEKQKKHLENMRRKKLEKARKKKEEEKEQFKSSVEGNKVIHTNTHNEEKPAKKVSHNKTKQANNYDDDFLFKNMERVIGLVERLTQINNNKTGGYRQAIKTNTNIIKKSQPIPIPKPNPKVELHGYDDFF